MRQVIADKKEEKISIKTGRILGLDYGTKRIGLAVSDTNQTQAFVYDTLIADNKTFEKIKEICTRELIDKIIVGLPLGLSGEYTEKTEEVICFIAELETRTKLVVETEDERLSSVEASKNQNGQGIDESAAQIILQRYLDKKNNNL